MKQLWPEVGWVCVDERGWVIEVLGVRKGNMTVEFVHMPADLSQHVGKMNTATIESFRYHEWTVYDVNEVPL